MFQRKELGGGGGGSGSLFGSIAQPVKCFPHLEVAIQFCDVKQYLIKQIEKIKKVNNNINTEFRDSLTLSKLSGADHMRIIF